MLCREDEKRLLIPLKLEPQMVGSLHVGAGTQLGSSGRSAVLLTAEASPELLEFHVLRKNFVMKIKSLKVFDGSIFQKLSFFFC